MKILFVGDHHSNAGPANVNKQIIENLTEEYHILKASNLPSKIVELFWEMNSSDVLVLSGITKIGMAALKLAKLMKIKSIYMMHGCAEYEVKMNGREPNSQLLVRREKEILKAVDLILPVSRRFSDWVKKNYPQYKNKIQYLFNGVEQPEKVDFHGERLQNRVIAVGADRATKNNSVLCEAVEELGGFAKLIICGKIHSQDSLSYSPNIQYLDLIPQKEFYLELCKSNLFVLNSTFEPFSLSVIDALNCGCSILVSNDAGIVDLLELKDTDIIFDPNDKKEIQTKIQYLLANPNNSRIVSCLDYKSLSYQKRVEELTSYCEKIF